MGKKFPEIYVLCENPKEKKKRYESINQLIFLVSYLQYKIYIWLKTVGDNSQVPGRTRSFWTLAYEACCIFSIIVDFMDVNDPSIMR